MQLAFYILTFILSMGITSIGVHLSYSGMQLHKKQQLSFLLYQQIFLFSFFFYSIWGGIAINEIFPSTGISIELLNKIRFFFPLLGMPFLLVSWFMLIKTAFLMHGLKFNNTVAFYFFPIVLLILISIPLAVQRKLFPIPESPDQFMIAILTIMNIIPHVILIVCYRYRREMLIPIQGKWIILQFTGVLLYSPILIFHVRFGYIGTCLSIFILFLFSIILPVGVWLSSTLRHESEDIDFDAFCKLFEISKREAEIIQEICSGKTNQAIADKLFITLQTVKDHNHRIYTKTGVKNRVQLQNLVLEKTNKAGSPLTLI